MSLFKNLLEGFVSGLVANAPHESGAAKIERLCYQLGWSVDERDGNAIGLHFNDSIVRLRKVTVLCGEKIAVLTVPGMSVSAREVRPEALAHLLVRNAELASCAWLAYADGGNVTFAVKQCLFTDGLEAHVFKLACETILREAHDYHAKAI